MKMMIRTLITAGLIATAAVVFAAGTVEEVTYYSDALGEERAVLVYLPEGYTTSGLEYPVVYLIPGFSGRAGNRYSVPEFIEVLDTMIGDGLVDPFIFVEVDPSCLPWAPALPFPVPSYLTDSELNGQHETALVEELVPWIDATFRTKSNRDHRLIFGRSAGGYAATRIALRHPDVFGGLGTQVGVIAIEALQAATPLLLAEYPAGPPYQFSPIAGQTSMFMFSWAAALTPNITNQPWYVDLWVDQDGNIDADVWQRFVAQSCSRWAAELAQSGEELDIFMDYGDVDFFAPFTGVFAASLDAIGLPYTLEVFAGDHDNPPMWQRLQTHVTYFFPLKASAELDPGTLNCRSKGRWVTGYIELPGGISVTDIDLPTLAITGIDGTDLETPIHQVGPTSVSDVNGNGVPDVMVKFDRSDLIEGIGGVASWSEPSATVTIRGEMNNGWFLEAEDTLRLMGRCR